MEIKMNISQNALKCIERGDLLGVSVSVQGVEGSITLSEHDICSLDVSRMSVSGDKLELGSAVSSELKLKLYNSSGRFNNFIFEGAELYTKLVVKLDNGTVEYIPMGYFTVDEQPRRLSTVSLSALDRMARFDRPYDTALSFPATLYGILSDACSKCGVPLKTLSSELTNSSYRVEKRPEVDGLTYHQIIIWIAELTGDCAWIDWDGKLRLSWYETSNTKLTPNNLTDLDIQENNITITGVQIVANDEDGTPYLSGTDDYAFNIVGNLLVQADLQSIANALGDKLTGFTYRPYKCTARELPHLWQMERVTLTDADGKTYSTIINQHNYSFGGKSVISAKGQTAKRNRYATSAPLTARERAILERLRAQTHREISDRQQAALEMNEIMLNSGGLYQTGIEQPDGSVKYYFHDSPKLEESSYICTRNAGGFASTTSGWNNGNPVWINGVTRDGNAVLNAINTYKLVADLIVAGRLQSKDGASFFDLDTGIAQFLGEFTAKSQSYDPSLDVSATLRGFNVDSSNPDEVEGIPAGLYFEDSNSNIFAHLIGVLLGKWKILQLSVNNEEGDTASMIQLTSSGVATVQDSCGSGQIFHTGNLLIESGIADMTGHFWQGNGGWDGMITVYPKSGKLFTSNAVPVVSVNTSWTHAFQAGCKRPSFDGSFEIWCHASNVYSSAPAVSVSWLLTEVKA